MLPQLSLPCLRRKGTLLSLLHNTANAEASCIVKTSAGDAPLFTLK